MVERRCKHGVTELVLDRDVDQSREDSLESLPLAALESPFDSVGQGVLRASDQRGHERGLVRKVLVDRSDTDAGDLRNAVRVEAIERLVAQNASSRFKDRFDRDGRAGLPRLLSGE
jgi:hypothetical protein